VVTNIGFDRGHPYVEEGADEGELRLVGPRLDVTSTAARAVAFTLERSIDGGTTWEPVLAETISGTGANLTDYESLSYGDTLYRAVAFTTEGATAETTITVPSRSGALWLSGGAAFGDTARLPLNPEVSLTAGRERVAKRYAGRSFPVAYVGEALNRTFTVSGMVTDRTFMEETATPNELVALSQSDSAVFLFRDPDGRRVYGVIGDISMPRQSAAENADGWLGIWGVNFTLTETSKEA